MGATIVQTMMGVREDFLIYISLGLSLTALVVFSLLTSPPPEEKWRPFAESGK